MMQLVLIVLTKTKKKRPAIANHSDTEAKALSQNVSNNLTFVSIPTKDRSQQ
jgi:hypothetical protein